MSTLDAIRSNILNASGTRPIEAREYDIPDADRSKTSWYDTNWRELCKAPVFPQFLTTSSYRSISFVLEALPCEEQQHEQETSVMLADIQTAFGGTGDELASILHVTRQTLYNYKRGMEPAIENKRRVQYFARLAKDFMATPGNLSKGMLTIAQPEGYTLLDLMSAVDVDSQAVRTVVTRIRDANDRSLRGKLAAELAREETTHERSDIARDRSKAGKPVYVGVPDAPGKLIRIHPDGKRTRGQMINRQFVPDD
jgi:hypothetical protein